MSNYIEWKKMHYRKIIIVVPGRWRRIQGSNLHLRICNALINKTKKKGSLFGTYHLVNVLSDRRLDTVIDKNLLIDNYTRAVSSEIITRQFTLCQPILLTPLSWQENA